MERKAEDITIMEMKQRSAFCDYFVVMSAPSSVRVKAIVDHVEDTLRHKGFKEVHREGYKEALWVLMDYGDVVVHVFYPETRAFYNLENLWGDVHRFHFSKE